jgi:hypothetical protein
LKRMLARVRRRILLLKVARRRPPGRVDQRIFDRTWSDRGRLSPTSREFLDGKEPHQIIQAKAIKDEHKRSGRVLSSLTSEAANYLVIFVMFTGLIGFATTSAVVLAIKSPNGWLVILPGALLFMLLSLSLVALVRSHASKLKSWMTNYRGPGRRVRHITTQYAYINYIRIDTMMRNWYAQRAKRMLSLVSTLYLVAVLLICAAVIAGVVLLRIYHH